jgi:hypothetical protein
MTESEEDLVMYLERDQLVWNRARPVARARLDRPAAVGLWALGVLAVVLSAMVIYTFVSQLGH